MVQFLEKDATLTEPVCEHIFFNNRTPSCFGRLVVRLPAFSELQALYGLLKFWPCRSSPKEVGFAFLLTKSTIITGDFGLVENLAKDV